MDKKLLRTNAANDKDLQDKGMTTTPNHRPYFTAIGLIIALLWLTVVAANNLPWP